jgi:hypothetical protein
MGIKIRKLSMTKRNKKSKALKWNEDQPSNLKKKPQKTPNGLQLPKLFHMSKE